MEPPAVANGDVPSHNGRGRRLVFWLITILIPLAFLELFGLAATRLAPQLFDQREATLATFTTEAFEQYRAHRANLRLGWENPAATIEHEANCGHVEITYTYDADRLRLHGPTTLANAVVLVAGDSYTQGYEVGDNDTFPAVLERTLGTPVANLGVGGYGPDQALLRLESLIDRAPRARVMVLAIMTDDARRMLNSYRPTLTGRNTTIFSLKPYVRGDEFMPIHGGDPFRSLDAMRAAATEAFDDDFWARPRASFPYSIALVRAAFATANWYEMLERLSIALGWERNELFYRLPPVRQGLRTVFARFALLAEAHKLQAVVAFIPADYAERRVSELGIAAATEAQGAAIHFVNVGGDFDWRNFNGPTCHPNANGYRMIAEDVARAVRPLLPQ